MSLSKHLEKYGEWALVAGGANGLGRAFCERLLREGKNVIAVDSDEITLGSTCEELGKISDHEIIPVVLDLSSADAPKAVMQLITRHECRLLVYNAAYGPVRKFEHNSTEQLDLHIDLNARTLLQLCCEWVKYHGTSSPAGFIAVSSMAGIRGTLLVAPYAATKAFTWNLMESLYYEYRHTQLEFAAMCAGPISTPNYLGNEPRKSLLLPKPDTPEYVARKALYQLGKRPLDFPGLGSRLSNFLLTRVLPRSWASGLNNSVMARTFPQSWKDT